jgi:DNA-binding NarL/FixJ family response regulator
MRRTEKHKKADTGHDRSTAADAANCRSTVLVVDDVQPMRHLLKRILSAKNLEIITAESAAEARKVIASHQIDLMLCDLMMPGEPGESLIQYVTDNYADIAVVVITGVTEPTKAERVLEIGVVGYLIKPLDKNQVLITVSNALRLRNLERRERNYRQRLEKDVQSKTLNLISLNETLQERQRLLQRHELSLRDATGAIRTLLDQRNQDRTAFESEILENVDHSIQPYIQRLKDTHLSPSQSQYVESLEISLKNIISPFIKAISSSYLNLTPAELQVADLIRHGKRTKDIAEILNLSPNTVMTHRYHLRDKLGLKNRRISLITYLKTLEHPPDKAISA